MVQNSIHMIFQPLRESYPTTSEGAQSRSEFWTFLRLRSVRWEPGTPVAKRDLKMPVTGSALSECKSSAGMLGERALGLVVQYHVIWDGALC